MRWPAVFLAVGLLGFCAEPLAEPLAVPAKVQVALVQRPLDMPDFTPVNVELTILHTVLAAGHTYQDYLCMRSIAAKESMLNPDAVGDSGDSHGLWQRHAPSWGHPGDWTVHDQTVWALNYANSRYGSPCAAWDAWQQRAAARGGKGWW